MRTFGFPILLLILAVAGYFAYQSHEAQQTQINNLAEEVQEAKLGAFRPSGYTGTLLTRLNEGGSESSFNTTPCTTPDGQTISTSAVGDYIVLTINPGAANEEKISATAVSCSGTTLTWTTGTRGLSFLSTSQVAANVNQHSIGETVIISNDDQFLATQYVNVDSNQTIAGQKTFTLGALFSTAASSTAECTVNSEYCTKLYIDNSVNQGAATSTETAGGIVELATAQEQASSTPTTPNIPLVLQAENASSSPSIGCQSGYSGIIGAGCAAVGDLDGTLWDSIVGNLAVANTWDAVQTFNHAIVGSSTPLTDGATVTVNWASSNTQEVVLGGNRTIAFSNLTTGTSIKLLLCQDGTGSRTISSWPSEMRWQFGSAPTLTTTADKCDVISLFTSTSTDTVFGAISPNF